MKKLVYINSIIWLVFSCSGTENKASSAENENKSEEITLTDEQIKTNGIKFGKPELRYIDTKITVSGVIHALPENKSSIHSQVDGFIDKVNFITGEFVKKGQVLATVRNPSFITLQKQFLEAYYNMNLNLKDYQRKQSLLSADAISRKAYEQSQALYQVSSAEYEGLRSELQLLGFNPSTIIRTKKINPILAIVSPKSGFVHAEEISPGKQITTADELFMIINQDELHIELNVPSKHASGLFTGQNVEFMLPEIKDTLRGSIHLIGKVTNTENNTIQVHVDIDSKLPPTNFYEGRFVNASIINRTNSVLTLPKEAIFEEAGKKYVFVKKGEHVEKKEVKTGAENEQFVEIMDWDNQLQVAVSGVYYLKAGEMESGHSH
ncbi:efflux RND transporter periplasmic adaptor subunit [Apibacter raozihei]|uniref:efflux RND transporter periplasmic adaptor subunit n=1 Tax=Apibacter TaxID=1778601 RepID=UPI000FE42941|nr:MULTISPECIES: efflux RND transporter periplasmic adaptor subunit [Apibacter]